MLGQIGRNLTLGVLGGTTSLTPLRIVPIDAYEAYAIAPHAQLGAVALHLIYGNDDNPADQTPAASLGAPFGEWRIRGFRTLPSVASDPVTQYNEIIYAGVGSQEYAINVNNVYGGTYHGGLDDYIQTGTDVTSARMISSLELDHTATINWAGGEVAQMTGKLEYLPGAIARTTHRMVCPYNTLTAALALFQLSTAYKRVSMDLGVTWTDATTVGYYDTSAVNEVWWRNPNTGTIAKVLLDRSGATNFEESNFDVSSSRVKYRARFDTPTSGNFGDQTCIAQYSFGYLSHDKLLPLAKNYDNGPYSAYLSAWGASGYVAGVDYTAFMDIEEFTFPVKTRIRTQFTSVDHPGVWGYFFVAKGDYRASPGSGHPAPVQIGSLDSFTETFDFSYEGSENFNLLSENWLTSVEGDWDTITYEVGWFYHYETNATHWFLRNHGLLIGDYNDGVRTWRVRFHENLSGNGHGAGFCTFALNDIDLLSGTIDKKAAYDWLLTQSTANPTAIWALDPNWWMNGTSFGSEVTNGGGATAIMINAFDATWTVFSEPTPFSMTETFDTSNPSFADVPFGHTYVGAAGRQSSVSGGVFSTTGVGTGNWRWVKDTPLQPGTYEIQVDYRTGGDYTAGGIKVSPANSGTGTGAQLATQSFTSAVTPTTMIRTVVIPTGQLGYITYEASTTAGRSWHISETRVTGTPD